MRPFTRKSRLVTGFIAAILIAGASSAFACAICKSSPDSKFGFCRWGYDRGWNDCTETVTNTFTGATSCTLDDPSCGLDAGGGDPTGGYQDCHWTDLYGNCIQAY